MLHRILTVSIPDPYFSRPKYKKKKKWSGLRDYKKPGSEDFVWNVVRPFNSTKKTLKLPVFPDISETISLQMPTHFELFYYDYLHYNAIVSEDTGKVCTHLPKLPDNYSELIQL